LDADLLALQEIGGPAAFEELRTALLAEGMHYDHWEIVAGHDPHISVALLSRFPITARRPRSRESFLLLGRRFFVSRGFLEVDLQVAPDYQLTLFSAHLKSRRPVPEADEAELREQEARLLRERINIRLSAAPQANVVVLGDFNDTRDSKSLRTLIGKGKDGLIDTRPSERSAPDQPDGAEIEESRVVTWTHYYGKEDTYSRIDYLLISRGLYHEWDREGTQILVMPDWGLASDHRPLVATFRMNDRGMIPASRKRPGKGK
jgi:endonuclease/exonuclease/phosphatase family metal-dependent hydrolase